MTTDELNSLTVGTFLEYLQKNSVTDTDMLIYIRGKANRDRQILKSILAKVELELDIFKILWSEHEVPYLKTNLEELKTVINNELYNELSPQKAIEKTLIDMIEHKDKIEVIKKLNEWIPGAKTKKVATIIRALLQSKILYKPSNAELYRAMRSEFPDMQGSDSGLNKFLANGESITSQEINLFTKALESI